MEKEIPNQEESSSGLIGEFNLSVFKSINKIIMDDLNKNSRRNASKKYSRDQIEKFLQNPESGSNAKNLREAVLYIYRMSPHFRRIVQYFAGLSDLSYVVIPSETTTNKSAKKRLLNNYKKCLVEVENFRPHTRFRDILTVVFREDVFYGTIWHGANENAIQQLPFDYCAITSIVDGVPNVTFDFSYFDTYPDDLLRFPSEFSRKYEVYKANPSMKWQELDSPNSFAVKCNRDQMGIAVPPLSGILRSVYDIEDYKALRMTRAELENYAILVMTIPTTPEGDYAIDLEKAKKFWRNLDAVLPSQVGSILTPMDLKKIGFEKTNTAEIDDIANSEQHLFTAAGVSSLLFNNEKASSSSLLLSIKADQMITYSVVKSIEDVINRWLRAQPFGKSFKVDFLDVSAYNRKEMADMYQKACTYGIPAISYYCAAQGISQIAMDTMNFLEDDLLGLKSRYNPLRNSATISSSDEDGGRPVSDDGDLTDSGESSRENQ